MKNYILIGAVVVGLVVGLLLLTRENKIIYQNDERNATTCISGKTKVDNLGNIFTCIENAWIYTGSTNEETKG